MKRIDHKKFLTLLILYLSMAVLLMRLTAALYFGGVPP